MPLVYMAVNTVNNKRYIGATKHSLERRKARHLYDAFSDKARQCARFYNAIRKYGTDSFLWEVLKVFETIKEAYAYEMTAIAEMKPEYNISRGGIGGGHADVGKKVICLEDGQVFATAKQAARHYAVDHSSLLKCCKPTTRHCTTGGLHFLYYRPELSSETLRAKIVEKIDRVRQHRRRRGGKVEPRPVRCITTEVTFRSITAAARFYGLPASTVHGICAKRQSKTLGGFSFEYAEAA